MSELRQQLIDLLHDKDFATFDKLVVNLEGKHTVSVAQIAYKVQHIEGLKRLVLNNPERNYSLLLQQLIACKDTSNLGVWLLEYAPKTTIGTTTYKTLQGNVDAHLYVAMIERQSHYLEPRFLMVSARHHEREDFALRAVRQLEQFPLSPNQLQEFERQFLDDLLSFKSLSLLEEMFSLCSHRIVLHALAMQICCAHRPKDFVEILKEVLDRYIPTPNQLDQLNVCIQDLIEYENDDMDIVRCLMQHYNPHFKDGETFFYATYLKNELDFIMFLDVTPLEIQKNVLAQLAEPVVSNKPPQFGLLQNRIADQEVRMKLQCELENTPQDRKTRLM